MLRSLYSGMTGVKNQQAQLDVISNNIANVNTIGYKSARMTFADAISDTLTTARGTAGNFGGNNPIQIGRGSIIASVDNNFKQGSVDATGITEDIALNGKGFFIVNDGHTNYYTRAGAFQIMDDGTLLSQGGKNYVMGRLANDNGKLPSTTALNRIVLPYGRKEPAKATENVEIYCNLDKNASKVEEWLGKDQLMVKGQPAKLLTDLAMIDGNNLALGDVIEITGTDREGKKILDADHKEYTFTYGVDGTTIQDFINKINLIYKSTNPIDGATMSLDQAGRMRLIANSAGEGQFGIYFSVKNGTNHTGTAETRNALVGLMTVQPNRINQLNGSDPSMHYLPGDTMDITYAGQTRIFSFATGNETLQDIANFMNNNFYGAQIVIRQGATNDEVYLDDIGGVAFDFSNSSGTANGLDGTVAGTPYILTGNSEPATISTDLRNLLNMTLDHGDTIEIVGTNPDGTYVSGTFTYGQTASGTTVQDLLNTINKTFYGVTATLSPNGTITMTDNAPAESLSSISLFSGTSAGFDIAFQTEIFTQTEPFMDRVTGIVATVATNINDIESVYNTPYQIGDIIEVYATQLDGVTRKVSFKFGAQYDGTTLDDFINRINNSNEFPGLTATLVNGQVVFNDATVSDLNDYTSIQIVNGMGTIGKGLQADFTSNAGTSNSVIKVPTFTQVEVGATGKHHSAITVYDSAGQAHKLEIYYTQDTTIGSNKWYWEMLIDDGKLVPISGGSGTVTFNDNGSLRAFLYDNGTNLRFQPLGAEEVKIKLNGGVPGGFNGMTSTDAPSTNILIEQDGYQQGVLNNVVIDKQGVINGIYSNGVNKTLAQIALANFTNEGGLQKEGNSLYSANAASGNAMVTWAGTNNKTEMKSGYLEASNVDLTDEFANLIVAQRALEANAKVVTTADSILTTIIDRLKRT